jgi:hypothetical protein
MEHDPTSRTGSAEDEPTVNASRASEILALEATDDASRQAVPDDEREAVVAAHLLLDAPR